MREGLTLFVVFQNGKDKLERCLESARFGVDEIVAVDTGANDGSREVAERIGARLYDLEWPDAFDEAYNFAISKVETEWTLWLDSDEWLLPNATFMLQEVMYNPILQEAFILNLIRQDIWDEHGNFSEMYQTRMWRTHPHMRLQGVIHAQFPEPVLKRVGKGRRMLDTQIRFRHDGFIGGVTKEKIRRNLPYLLKEDELRPGQLYFEICIAESYLLLEDPSGVPRVMELLERILNEPEPGRLPRQAILVISLYLDHILPNLDEESQIDQICDFVMKHFNTNIPVLWALQQYYMQKGNAAIAYQMLKRIEELHRTGTGDRFAGYNPRIVNEALLINLGTLAERFGDKQVAVYCYKKLANLFRDRQESPEFAIAISRLNELGVLRSS